MDKENTQQLESLRAAVEADPDDLQSALRLAQLYADLGWHNQALDFYKKIISRNKNDFSILLEYGNLCFRRQDLSESEKVFRKLTTLKPGRIEGWNNLGTALLRMDKQEEAFTAFGKVLEIEPDNPGALLNLGTFYDRRGDNDTAREMFNRAVKAKPDFPDAWFDLGNSFLKDERYTDAVQAFEKAIRYYPEFASAQKNLGFAHEQMDELDTAERCYEKALAVNKTDPHLYVNLANIYSKRGEFDKAKKFYYSAVKISPREMAGWMGLRHLALLKGDIASFLQSTLAVIHRLNEKVIAETVVILHDLNHSALADQVIDRADELEIEGDHLDSRRIISYLHRKRHKTKTQALYRRLCAVSAPADLILRGCGEYALEKGSYNKAVKLLSSVKAPNGPALVLLWKAMVKAGAFVEARESITAFLKDNEDSGDAWFFLAVANASLGQKEDIEECLSKAMANGFGGEMQIDEDPVVKELCESIECLKIWHESSGKQNK